MLISVEEHGSTIAVGTCTSWLGWAEERLPAVLGERHRV